MKYHDGGVRAHHIKFNDLKSQVYPKADVPSNVQQFYFHNYLLAEILVILQIGVLLHYHLAYMWNR